MLQSMGSQRVRHDWATELNWEHHQSTHKKIKANDIWHIFKNDCCVEQDTTSTYNPTPVHLPSPSTPQAPPFPPFISQLYALPVLNTVLLFSMLCISCLFPWIIKPSSRMEGLYNQPISLSAQHKMAFPSMSLTIRTGVKTPERQDLPHCYTI